MQYYTAHVQSWLPPRTTSKPMNPTHLLLQGHEEALQRRSCLACARQHLAGVIQQQKGQAAAASAACLVPPRNLLLQRCNGLGLCM